MEHAMPTMAAESEGATTDDDVHLSPTSVSSGGGGGGGGGPPSVRFKILCSFGGRIMPRPSDGALKYIGGDTRVLAVPRSIRFRDLKKKVEEMFKTDVAAIKYQLLSSDDLDVLVSVTCDEDLAHMLDEYDRFEAKRSPSASPRFRVYVFVPHQVSASSAAAAVAAPVSSSRHVSYARNQPHYHPHHHHLQPERERYVASVPGTPDGSPPYPDQPNGVASAGNSPRANIVEQAVFRGGMQRVRSSPNLGGLNAAPLPFHDHAGDSPGGLAGYMSGSPVHPGAGHMFSQGSYNPYRSPQPQYSPAPVPVPHHAGVAGRYDSRGGYARGGSYKAAPLAPALRSGRPVSRSGGAPYSEMQTPKKAATIWD
ncbi:hypothetical protein CFC21_012416 [Triticum aestivum]|uniref:PB1 domain-containing protein n=7 Tax=Triticinae TaxID=1648030 RepID=A0A3B5ZWA1_WHEAT|nr:uncharacterized protein LOC109772898 [Aegilops tauschii subsp. strangulata]XP_020187190.1 uncharacterized protein LOC109772898 [Aegilops tauschii subsp. strangulata]XP_044450499.1 uncharacterized protein LOC123182102 [Triticum aestivum]XP_044450502.1 uncharacterized protein LOC123182102 [Triticum aestivum]KAF6996012.1 hypothetical protein CFC21_012416 [Triticum aestivum]